MTPYVIIHYIVEIPYKYDLKATHTINVSVYDKFCISCNSCMQAVIFG